MELKNFHTHTTFCDGKHTPEQMITAAIEQKLTALGFSGHSYTDFDTSYCMKLNQIPEYINTVTALKEKYKSKIRIYCGIENDCYSEPYKNSHIDYTIGAVHYIKVGSKYLAIDYSAELQQNDVKKYFGGSFIAYCEKYYETVAGVINKTHADFIAHFDLVTKFNEGCCLFDTNDSRYIKAWQQAADELIKSNMPFEINTGAIARGVRKTPYPSPEIARYITSHGGKLILNSDCHNKDMLLCGFEDAEKNYGNLNISDFEELRFGIK